MLIRIVRMEFKPEKVDDFLNLFEDVKDRIATFPGCKHLELCQDAKETNVYYTFSKWDGEEYLDKYRQSPFFASTWSKTKALFGGKPDAYSLLSDK